MYNLVFGDGFEKKAEKFLDKHLNLWSHYENILKLLRANPHHPSLRTHKLSGKLEGKWAVSITISYRLIIRFVIKDNLIILLSIGTHDEVY